MESSGLCRLSTSGFPESTHLPEFHHTITTAGCYSLCQVYHAGLGRLTRITICDQSNYQANKAFGVARTPDLANCSLSGIHTQADTHPDSKTSSLPARTIQRCSNPAAARAFFALSILQVQRLLARAKDTASHHDEPMIAACITEVIAKGKCRAIIVHVWTAAHAGDFSRMCPDLPI